VLNASNTSGANTPTNTTVFGKSNPQAVYGGANNLGAMDPRSIGDVGGSQAHLNMQPFLTLTFCIALQGIFPSQN
jgi:microcystin-dependent protein